MCNLTDHGLGVYLIVRGPGGFTGGKVVDAMVSLLDLVPTACELAGLASGPTLGALVRGEVNKLHDELFGEVTYHAAYEPQRSSARNANKYIRRWDDRQKPVLPNTDDCLTRQFLIEQGWTQQPRDREMLFDLVFRPRRIQQSRAAAGNDRSSCGPPSSAGSLDDDHERSVAGRHVPPPKGATGFDPNGWSCADTRIRSHESTVHLY